MNRHTQIRQAVLARLREQCGDSATFFDGLPAFIDAQELPAVAVWLSDAQYTGKMTDEDDWQAVLHIAVFIRAQAPDSELDMWMESTIFPALNDIGINKCCFNFVRRLFISHSVSMDDMDNFKSC